VRFKSKFSISAILVAALLALLSVVPALGGSQTVGEVTLDVRGGSGTAAAFDSVVQDTRVGTTLYVGNSNDTYDEVVITVTHAAQNQASGAVEVLQVTVSNATTGSSLGTLDLRETGANTGIFGTATGFATTGPVSKSIFTVGTTTNVSSLIVGASDGNEIRVTYNATQPTGYIAGTGAVGKLVVDATKPVITGISPTSGGTLRPGSVDFSGTITDTGSGIRSDGAPLPGADGPGTNTNGTTVADGDADGITSGEPRTYGSNANEKDFAATPDVGTAVDIRIFRAGAAIPAAFTTTASTSPLYGFVQANDLSENALWAAVTNGFSFTATIAPGAGDHRWGIAAKDRAGNTSFTDSTGSTAGSQSHVLTIDGTAPAIALAETGKAWNAATKEESTVTNRKSIKITWTSGGATPAGTALVPTNGDFLDTNTVQASDFSVLASATSTTELAIANVVHPNLKPGTGNVKPSLETRHITYIELVDDMTSAQKVLVKFVGTMTDLAGNAASTHQKVATDAIPPKLTVTITGVATAPPVVKGTATTLISIRVDSDEVLSGTPTIYLMDLDTSAADVVDVGSSIVTVGSPLPVSGTTLSWTTTQSSATVGQGLINVVVLATDANSVKGSSGSGASASKTAPVANNVVNLATALLFEFDATFAAASLTLTPTVAGTTTTTESSGPFVRIDFSEGGENLPGAGVQDLYDCGPPSAGAATVCKPKGATGVGTDPTRYEIDAHNTVTLTTLTLDGVDVLGTQGTVDSDSFVLATAGLSVGTHTVTFNGTDAVANTFAAAQSFTFTVIARSAYTVPVSPGWNLISFPGDPIDTAIDAVIPSTHPATQVLTYDPSDADGPWLVATRATDGSWTGTLATVDSSRAYWVRTGAFTSISTLIPERDPSAVLPTIAVGAGWNLVSVIDLQTGKAPTQTTLAARTAGLDPDLYFSSITWTVAYGFDTQGNQWRKITPSATVDNVGQGKGYWVWATKAGTLVP
jgi:hypothetical protein